MDFKKHNFKMIFAHPDDEVLWASSILKYSNVTFICFSESPGQESISYGRSKAFENFPLKNVMNLCLSETGKLNSINWRNPKLNAENNYFRKYQTDYKKTFNEIYKNLKTNLYKDDVIITHNPWGEYGHEEHVLVFDVIKKLSKEIGFRVFVTGYVSNKSIYLMHKTKHFLSPEPIKYMVDKNIIDLLCHHYKKNKIWTWWDDYKWPKYEYFFALSENHEAEITHSSSEGFNHILFSENLISFKDIIKFFLKNNIIKLKHWFNGKR